MSLETILQEIGFLPADALYLAEHRDFHHKQKTKKELTQLFSDLATFYDCSTEVIQKIIVKKPNFTGYDHQRMLEEAVAIYGQENDQKIKKAVLKFPPFASLDHQRVLDETMAVYGQENEQKIKKATLTFPPFAGLNHQRVQEEAITVYGRENEQKIKKATLTFPPFAGYNHQRVLRQKGKLGRLANLEQKQVIDEILKTPALSGYSAKRYLAAFDVARELEEEGFVQNSIMLQAFFINYSQSPYVPNTNKKRISQVENGEEPPLLTAMRKYLTNYINKQ